MNDERSIFHPLLRPYQELLADGAVLSIGNFDGVHIGHQAILADLRERADALGVPAVALTFEPHPVTVFRGRDADEFRLSTGEERERLLRAHGVDAVLTATFDREFGQVTPERFVLDLIVGGIRARHVLVGYDFNFGRGRRGNTETLREIASRTGVAVTVHSAVERDGVPVSSTRVRRAVADGALDEVAALLGRPLSFSGMTEAGAGRGRTMGIPTLNLYPTDRLLPLRGVYATRVRIGSRRWDAVSNLGVRPSFDDGDRVSLETMVLTPFDAVEPGTEIAVELVTWIRAERRFETPDALREQIRDDVAVAERSLRRTERTGQDAE